MKTKNGLIIKKCKVNVSNVQEGVLVEFDDSLKVDGNEISNLNIEHLKVSEILSLINTNMNLEMYRFDDTKLEQEDKIGTGSKLVIKDVNGNIVYQYKFILYGDVNGDGNINSLDVLVLQKHLLEIKLLNEEFIKAANISKNGMLPSSLDVLKIQKHILEIKTIEQGDKLNFETNVRIIRNIEDLNEAEEVKNNFEKENINSTKDVDKIINNNNDEYEEVIHEDINDDGNKNDVDNNEEKTENIETRNEENTKFNNSVNTDIDNENLIESELEIDEDNKKNNNN